MILPKNAASLISDSLATVHKGSAGKPEHEEKPMDEMEAFGHSILDAIKSGDAKGLAESLKGFTQTVSMSEPEPPDAEPMPDEASEQPPQEG